MKIGLIDVDGHNFPNLALMKISAWHKSIGNSVEWYDMYGNYEAVYKSKVFTFTPDFNQPINNSKNVISGGTGYGFEVLPTEIENICPDYTIYPKYKEAYGFLTRGCPNKCSWCIVPKKEGNIQANADIETFLSGRKVAILLDNNALSCDYGLKQIEKIARLGIKIDFNQGLDARIIAKNESIAELLASVKWYKPIRMACDTMAQMEHIEKATELLRKHKATPSNYFVYVLVKDIEDAYKRVEFLRKLKLDPFAQPFRNFENNYRDKSANRFSRWVNHKAIFKTVKWEQYR